MRRRVLICSTTTAAVGLVVSLALAGGSAAAGSRATAAPLDGGPVVNFESADHQATVGLSSAKAGADDVAVTVGMAAELRCGRPFGPALVVTMPAATQLPLQLAVSDVRVNGRAPAKVAVSGRVVTVAMPAVHGVICDSIVDGTLKVAFAAGASIGNPAKAGSYTFALRRGTETHSVAVKIS